MLTKILDFIKDPRGAVVLVLPFVLALAIIICIFCAPGQDCTKYTIAYGDYRFHVDNYSVGSNSITVQSGSTNVTLVGNYAIYENNCEGK